MSSELTVEAKEIVSHFIEKDFKEWLGDELTKTVEKADKVAQVVIQIRWKAHVWRREYNGNDISEYGVNENRSYKATFDVVTDDVDPGIKTTEISIEIPRRAVDSMKDHLYRLRDADFFEMTITASTLKQSNFILDFLTGSNPVISSKEWTYKRTYGLK